ncbi:accessory colonization factor AcfC, partial [Escherichia coli]
MRNIMAGFLIFLSSAAYADINLYGPGGPHTALLDAAKLYAEKTGIIVNVHYGPQNKWNED